MQKLAENIWTVDAPHRFIGIKVRTRMTVVRLQNGQIWLHSPIALKSERRQAIEQLGSIRYIVAPNRYHHVYAGEWAEAYPDAELWGCPGLPEKRTDLAFDHVLTTDVPPWSDEIDQKRLAGLDVLREIVFYHRPSRTLISADLFFNESDADSLVTKAYLWINGILGTPGMSKVVRLAMNDADAVGRSIDRFLEWDFERIVVSHGQVLEEGARETLRQIREDL